MFHSLYSLKSSGRVVEMDEADDDFDVVSIDESMDECDSVGEEQEREREIEVEFQQEAQDGDDAEEWEEVEDETPQEEPGDVLIELNDGFHATLEAAIGTSANASAAHKTLVSDSKKPPTSPRRRSAREALRDFYLARAKTSEESSKNFRAYDSEPEREEEPEPAQIAPLRAHERYTTDVIDRVTREENTRKAQQALKAFYAQRESEKARRAAENRANEYLVYQAQVGSGMLQAPSGSCLPLLYWETTRFVYNGNDKLTT